MKKYPMIRRLLVVGVCVSSMALMACSDQETAVEKEPQTTSSGNKFRDSAEAKIMQAMPGITQKRASCIVDKMVSDGSVGLGEINQMKVGEETSKNPEHLRAAVITAVKACG